MSTWPEHVVCARGLSCHGRIELAGPPTASLSSFPDIFSPQPTNNGHLGTDDLDKEPEITEIVETVTV